LKALKWVLNHFEEVILVILVTAITLVMTLQISMRLIFNNAFPWPEELSRYMFIWFVYFGAAYGVIHKNHLAVDILYYYVPPGVKKIMQILADAVFVIFSLIMIFYGFNEVAAVFSRGQLSPAMQLPVWLIYLSLPVGFTLTLIRMIERYIKDYIYTNNTHDEQVR